jgi:aarF domain-containing kinase
LARAIAILEGIALTVDPKFKLVMEAYPFVTRRLLKDQRQGTQKLLRETIFDSTGRIKPQRFSTLINSALNNVNTATTAFIDLDTPPEKGASLDEIIRFLISDGAKSIRDSVIVECVEAGDLVLRETARKTFNSVKRMQNLKPLFGLPGPTIKVPIPPVFIPGKGLRAAEKVIE